MDELMVIADDLKVGDRVKVLEIAKHDAYYEQKNKIIGQYFTIVKIDRRNGDWISGRLTDKEEENDSYYFCWVRVKVIFKLKKPELKEELSPIKIDIEVI